MYKSYKFRVYPDKGQKALLNKSFGCSHFVYNHYLSLNKGNGYTNAYANIKVDIKRKPFTKSIGILPLVRYVTLAEIETKNIRI